MEKTKATTQAVSGWVEALEVNMLDYMEYYAKHLSSMEAVEKDGLQLINAKVPTVLFNYVCRSRLTGSDEQIQQQIQEAVAYFAEQRLPFGWWITPSTVPKDLPRYLKQNGLRRSHQVYEGMVMPLEQLPQQDKPQDLAIRIVSNDDELQHFADVAAEAFRVPKDVMRKYYGQAGELSFSKHHPIRLYIGYWEGHPAVTCILYREKEMAGIYSVATVPHARRRGFGTALTLAALRDAREEGLRLAGLQATEKGKSVYEQIGFVRCCTFLEYVQ
ncbi:GNAT family N-acetyltransferase [Paenibacillus senegalensis]|uniref:GNAT family N-acetyltransferase n=1 Tax=Paenibacillus senegalensis TaxID=1465766 RepID=UPI000289FE13|nr:GNAT family N-acetyltransferase [Paenibacillus senegalensis]